MASESAAVPDRPLAGRLIAVTRSVEDNQSLAGTLDRLGAAVVQWPMVRVLGPSDGGVALRAAIDRLADYRYVAVTSANGVRAVASALDGRPWPDGVEAMPVGPVTEAVAADHGMTVGAAPPVATAEALVDAFPPPVASGPNRVLAPLAELAGDTVTAGLAAKGYVVERVEAYRTGPPDNIVEVVEQAVVDRLDGLTFFSPSAVDRLADVLFDGSGQAMPTPGPVTVCIGPSTAARAIQRGLGPVVTAEPHTEDGVVTALIETFATT